MCLQWSVETCGNKELWFPLEVLQSDPWPQGPSLVLARCPWDAYSGTRPEVLEIKAMAVIFGGNHQIWGEIW